MATQDDTSDVLLNLTGFSPVSVDSPIRNEFPLLNVVPRGAADWYLYAYNRRKGTLTDINEAINAMRWVEDLENIVISGSGSISNIIDDAGHRASTYIGKGTELRMYVRNPVTDKIEEKDRFVVWDATRASDSSLSINFYDYAKYLADSKGTVLFVKGQRKNGWLTHEMTRSLCRQYGIKIGAIPRSRHRVNYFYQEGQPLLDILVRMWTLESKATGHKFVISIRRGRLYIKRKPRKPRSYVLELTNEGNEGGLLQSAEMTESLEGMVTSVRLWGVRKDYTAGTRDARRAVVKSRWHTNTKMAAAYGRIYLEEPLIGVTDPGDINLKARRRLKALARTKWDGRVSIVGYPYVKAGMAVRIYDKASGLNGLYWIKNLEHSIESGGSYTASGQVVRYDYTKKLATQPTDLKPDNPNAVNSTHKHTNSIPRPVWLALRAGARRAGLPESWANSKDLEKLLQKESRFSFIADNPSSTAYGLFQFLDSTWAKVGVPKSRCLQGAKYNGQSSTLVDGIGRIEWWKLWQCYAGLLYIKRRYGTPHKAWLFWQRHGWY